MKTIDKMSDVSLRLMYSEMYENVIAGTASNNDILYLNALEEEIYRRDIINANCPVYFV